MKFTTVTPSPRKEELKENIRKKIALISSKLLSPMRGLSACRGTAFATPLLICEL
jgi:hypothetical protein